MKKYTITYRGRTAGVGAEDRCHGRVARWLQLRNACILHAIRLSITAVRNGTFFNALKISVVDIAVIRIIGACTFLVALPLQGNAFREGTVCVSVK